MSRRHQNQTGFVLIEVLVAIAIAGIALTALFQLFSTSITGTERARQSSLALLTAESKLAEVGITLPLEPGRTVGEAANGYRWSVDILDDPSIAADARDRMPVRAFQVVVKVLWGNRGEITVETVRLRARSREE